MTFNVTIQEVTIDNGGAGKNKWQKATVTYTHNGQNRKQTVMSFSNPAVFAYVSKIQHPVSVNVTVTKNAKGYDEWAAVEPANNEAVGMAQQGFLKAAGAPSGGKMVGSNWETPEERAKRQLMIVRQSSISNAIEFLKLDPRDAPEAPVETVLAIAQNFVDFVYGTEEKLGSMDGIEQDIP